MQAKEMAEKHYCKSCLLMGFLQQTRNFDDPFNISDDFMNILSTNQLCHDFVISILVITIKMLSILILRFDSVY